MTITLSDQAQADRMFAAHGVIDVDTHLTEPPDVWTSRVPAAMRDQVPHIERIEGKDTWMVSGERLGAPGYYSMAGWDGVMPTSVPATYDEIHASMYDSTARLQFLDEQGLQAQVLYPNVGGFGNGYFLRLGDRELVATCVRAYNDFLTDWCSVAPDRLIAVTAIPFWDRDLPSRSCTAASSAATAPSTSATSPRTTASPTSPISTGTRSGRPPKTPASRSASTSAVARWAPSSSTTPGWAG